MDRRTLDASLDEGVLSRRVRGALEKALQSGVGSAAAQQRDRNDKLEDRLGDLEAIVEEQGKEMRAGRRAAEDAITEMREEQAQALRRLERALAELDAAGGHKDEAKASATGAGSQAKGMAATAGVPRPADPGACRGRRGCVRRGLALGSGVAGAEGNPPQRGQWPGVAAHRGAVPGGGAGAAGRPRDDPAPGPVPAAGLRPERADRLAPDRPRQHQEGVAKAGASAAGMAGPDPGTVAGVGGRSRLL